MLRFLWIFCILLNLTSADFKNCLEVEDKDKCAKDNYTELLRQSLIGNVTNGKHVKSFDPLYFEHEIVSETMGAELRNFTMSGHSKSTSKDFKCIKNDTENSFSIIGTSIVPKVNGFGKYILKCELGIFHFNAEGNITTESCENKNYIDV